jgi:ADP-ribosylglycohydrolase
MQKHYLSYYERLKVEILQSSDEGRDLSILKEEIENIIKVKAWEKREEKAKELLDKIQFIPISEDHKYKEPSNLDEIWEESEREFKNYKLMVRPDDKLLDKIYGAYLGRMAGCLLGKPIEGWPRDKIWNFLKDTNNFPINRYLSSDVDKEIKEKYGIDESKYRGWINKIDHMVEDDDINYTILGLYIFENYGENFTSEDVAESWLFNLPIFHTYTAERVAYQNLVNLIMPPKSGEFRNPYREWIGAQIRADFWGYINPGNPEKASEYAFRDACVSHVKNGIYGEMFIASSLSWAFVSDNIEEIIKVGLSVIPKKSRFYESIEKILKFKEEGKSFEWIRDFIYENYEKDKKNEEYWHNWCHVISNAQIVVASLLFSDLSYEKGITNAVSCGLDTDCNGATVGSILGAILGAKNLPEYWIKPLNDTVESGVSGYNIIKISDLAKKTLDIIKRL